MASPAGAPQQRGQRKAALLGTGRRGAIRGCSWAPGDSSQGSVTDLEKYCYLQASQEGGRQEGALLQSLQQSVLSGWQTGGGAATQGTLVWEPPTGALQVPQSPRWRGETLARGLGTSQDLGRSRLVHVQMLGSAQETEGEATNGDRAC